MNDDQFTKLFKYIEDFRGDITDRLDDKADKRDVERIMNALDAMTGTSSNSEIEQAARDAQFDRLLEWARKVSEKTGIPLEGF